MRVFISYARKDKQAVRELANLLEAGGHEPWFDNLIPPGHHWEEFLLGEIKRCDIFVYVLTPLSIQSRWCLWEFEEAQRLGKGILPLWYEDFDMTYCDDGLQRLQFLDCREGLSAMIAAQLMNSLERLVQRAPFDSRRTHLEPPRDEPPPRVDHDDLIYLRVSNLHFIRQVALFEGHGQVVTSMTMYPKGRLLASASYDCTVRLWDTQQRRAFRIPIKHREAVLAVRFSPSGRLLATASYDRVIRLWDVRAGSVIRTFRGHKDAVMSLEFSENGRFLASASRDQTVRLWDIKLSKQHRLFDDHNAAVWSVAFSPDGRTLAAGARNGSIKVWNLMTGTVLMELPYHQDGVSSLVYSPDGRYLFSASRDQSIRVWDTAQGVEEQVLAGHQDWVRSISLSQNGDLLASGSDDGTVRVWDVETSIQLHKLTPSIKTPVRSVIFTPDSRQLVTASNDGAIRLWGLPEVFA